MSEFWRSKLGNKYLLSEIHKNDKKTKAQLDGLRRTQGNACCADCESKHTVWASVNLGIFLCLRCGSIHRGLGTHISIPKGCTGSYYWGPDEIERMEMIGNVKSNLVYGAGEDNRPPLGASDSEWRQFISDKYEQQSFVGSVIICPPERDVVTEAVVSRPNFDANVTKCDLLLFDVENDATKEFNPSEEDFFSNYGL
mmetsp:Transcript_6756/g.9943  ORF Transcript_6756/g.9943 Transcript_6756/m.9943 type:complete len:197 (-) Transcript_6756:105-695(-)